MADFLFPLQFKRQYAAPLDIDIVFSTTAERLSYLTNPRRYPGQVVSDLQTESVYVLNSAGTAWKEAGGSGSTFTQNLTVSLDGAKTFGRYVNGDIIDSIGKTPSQVIQMSIVEPIKPVLTLTSPTTIAFNQTNINNVINFSHVIKSLGATVNTASLEFRRNNTGSWNILGTGTASTSSYNHILTDTPFNTQSFNYRYIVTDTIGATASAAVTITPVSYSAPTVPTPTIVAYNSLTSPETNTSREKGNVNSNISATITRNSPNVDLVSCIFQYKEDNGSWVSIGSPIPISGSSASVSLTNHIPSNTASNVYYRLSAYDGYQATVGNQSTLSLYNIIFYGSSSSTPTNSLQVRSLQNRIFTNGSNPFDLFTGTVNTKFTVAMPNNLSITGVIDLDASNANLTNSYVNNPFSVNDYAGTSYSYKVYTCSIATPYTPTEHRHRVTRG